MIEKRITDYLSACLPVPVGCEVPKGPPVSYVVLQKTGSGDENSVQNADFAVQSIASTLYGAMVLNESVKAAMDHFTDLTNIFRCHCETDYNFTNTETKEYRYQAVFHIIYKE